jgi:hypothetical protein
MNSYFFYPLDEFKISAKTNECLRYAYILSFIFLCTNVVKSLQDRCVCINLYVFASITMYCDSLSSSPLSLFEIRAEEHCRRSETLIVDPIMAIASPWYSESSNDA